MPTNQNQQAVFLQSGDPLTENRPADSYSGGQLGSRFTVQDDGINSGTPRRFQMVQLDSAMDVAPTAGAVAWWRNSSGYVVTTDVSVAGRGNVAGVFGGALTVDYIGCIQIGGRASVQIQTSPTAVPDNTGKLVIPSATDAKADVLAAGTAASYPPLGTSAGFLSGGLADVDLNLEGRQ